MTSDQRGICAVMHLLVLLQNVASDGDVVLYHTCIYVTSLCRQNTHMLGQ